VKIELPTRKKLEKPLAILFYFPSLPCLVYIVKLLCILGREKMTVLDVI